MREQRRAVVVDDGGAGRPRARGGLAGDGHHAEQRLREQVLARLLGIGAVGAVARRRRVDQAGLAQLSAPRSRSPSFSITPGPEVLRHHVGGVDQAQRELAALRADFRSMATLRLLRLAHRCSTLCPSCQTSPPAQCRCHAPSEPLDRDHVGAEIAQRLDAHRAEQEMVEAHHSSFSDLRPRVGQLDGVVPQGRRRRNEQVHLPFLGRRFEALDLVKGFEPMPRLGALRPDARAHPIQFLAQEPLPPPLGLFGDLLPDGLGFQVGGVIARMRKAPAIGQLDDPRGDHIQEIAVVRDKDDGAGELAQELLQPQNGFGVQMVGGLVQEQQIRLGRQSAAEGHPPLFAAGERPHQGIQRRRGQGGGGRIDAGLQLPAVRALDLVQQDRQLAVRAVSGFIAAQPLHQVRRARLDVLSHGEAAIQLELLRQITDAQSAPPRHFAGIRALMAGQNAQQAGLAAAVSAQQPDLLARGDRQRNGFEQSLMAVSQGEVVGGQ